MTFTPDFEATNFRDSVGHTTQSIVTCLRNNELNTKKIQLLLSKYSLDALLDGRFIGTARSDGRCVDHATHLLFAHVDFIAWLVSQNYTITASSVKWYSWRTVLNRRRFYLSPKFAQPQEIIERIRDTEEVVWAEIAIYQYRLKITTGLVGFQNPTSLSPASETTISLEGNSPLSNAIRLYESSGLSGTEFFNVLRKGWDTVEFLY
ncbi:glyoxalase family protein [Penicillium verhagenii]|uniref:glyoxalase family protein n=1 Tax=Penicillium verhagenii TaxID=1562060 RepID=UPI0025455984|nr:glyoxalase family protein [Penicillium verhagenii]KAJ5936520.1 glyoxalase family protein [Penicillium verhagenii]